jgi:hypothetical protein
MVSGSEGQSCVLSHLSKRHHDTIEFAYTPLTPSLHSSTLSSSTKASSPNHAEGRPIDRDQTYLAFPTPTPQQVSPQSHRIAPCRRASEGARRPAADQNPGSRKRHLARRPARLVLPHEGWQGVRGAWGCCCRVTRRRDAMTMPHLDQPGWLLRSIATQCLLRSPAEGGWDGEVNGWVSRLKPYAPCD